MNNLMSIFLAMQLGILLAAAQSQDLPSLNITTPLQDFVIHNRRQYDVNILRYEAKLTAYRSAYLLAANTIYAQTILLTAKLREVDEQINLEEILNDLQKHCIQKYRKAFVSAAAYKAKIDSCASSAISNIASILSSPEHTKNQCKSRYATVLPQDLSKCDAMHAVHSTNHTKCVKQVIEATDTFTLTNRETFTIYMRSSSTTGANRLLQALECSLIHFYNGTSLIAESMESINRCIDGKEFRPKCTNSSDGRCENYVDLSLHDGDFFNATMRNPLFGMSTNLDCLTVNFWKYGAN